MEDKILIDRRTLKAISSDTRFDILKHLYSKPCTLSELSEKLNLKNSTIKEHLDILCASGLIKKEDTNRKWKYYSVTFKGKKLVNPTEVRLFLTFIVSFLATLAFFGYFLKITIFGKVTESTAAGTMMVAKTFNSVSSVSENTITATTVSPEISNQIITASTGLSNSYPYIILGTLIILTIIIFIFYIIEKKIKIK